VTRLTSQAVGIFSKASDNNVEIALFLQGVPKKVSCKLLSTSSTNIDRFSFFSPTHSKENLRECGY